MRESSYNLSKENSQQPKDIRGGEKKVMKKSLSAILSLAMAFSMFSSVAFGAEDAAAKKSSADFDDLKDLTAEQKVIFDELIGAGVFDGVADKEFGLKDKMNRAQFAKVAALIFDLEVDASVKTSSFSDVKAEDPANGYALPYIEALKAAGLTDGYAPGQYNPAGEVTKQELATFLVRGLGWEADAKASAGVSDKTVSDWAKGYVAVAIEKKIMTSGEDGTFGGTSAATRDILVLSSYAADKAYVPAGKVSVLGAKATGASKVEVTLNKPVDTDKAKFELKSGTSVIATEAKYSDDKKTVTLNLKDVKLTDGEYTVTLSGLDADSVAEATAKFTATKETVKKITFTSPSDTIAWANKVRVEFAAVNQYEEAVSMSAGAFSVFATSGNPVIKKTDDGMLFVELQTNGDGIAQNVSQISINIYDTDRNFTATKTFKVGTAPYVSKVELRAPKYSNGGAGLAKKGEYVTVPMVEYDQYGSILVEGMSSTTVNPSGIVTPNINTFQEVTFAYNADGVREAKVTLKEDAEKNEEHTLTVYGGSSAATTTIKTAASKVAAKIEIESDGNFAEGDQDKYLTLVAYDVNGNKLSQQDIVENAKNDKFQINLSGAFSAGATTDVVASMLEDGIVTSGEHKGKIHIAAVTKGTGYVFAAVKSTTSGQLSNVQKTYGVSNPRYPVTLRVNGDDLAGKTLPNANSEVKLKLYDQNNSEIKKVSSLVSLTENGKAVTYDVYVNVTGNKEKFNVYVDGGLLTADTAYATDAIFDKKIKVEAKADALANEKVTVKVALRKKLDGVVSDSSVKTYSKEVAVVNPENETLTYAIKPLGEIFAAKDNKTYEGGVQDDVLVSRHNKQVELTAKDSGGNKVAINGPSMITSVTSSVYTVAEYGRKPEGNAYIIGNKAGTSTIGLTFVNAKKETQQLTAEVTVKADPITIASVVADKKSRTVSLNAINNTIQYANRLMELKVKDQYGAEYKYDSTDITLAYDSTKDYTRLYDKNVQVRYGVTDVDATNKADTVSVDADGRITVGATVKSFTLTAYAGAHSATTAIVVQ